MQNGPHLRILVIDDCSDDESYQTILKEFSSSPQVAVMRNNGNIGFAETLNKALDLAADEEFLFVLEQDCELLSDGYVAQSLRHFQHDHVAVVSGENQLFEDSGSSLMKEIFVHHLCEDVHDKGVVEAGFSLLKADTFRIDVLKKVGGFESSSRWKLACEEHIVSYKIRSAGYKIVKDSGLRFRAYWGRQESLWQNLKKEAIYGRGLGWALARIKSDLQVRESRQLRTKRFNRIVQAQYILLTVMSVFLFLYSPYLSLVLLFLTTLVHFVYLVHRSLVFGGVRERLLFVATGFLRSWVYIPNLFLGFLYGFVSDCGQRIAIRIKKLRGQTS